MTSPTPPFDFPFLFSSSPARGHAPSVRPAVLLAFGLCLAVTGTGCDEESKKSSLPPVEARDLSAASTTIPIPKEGDPADHKDDAAEAAAAGESPEVAEDAGEEEAAGPPSEDNSSASSLEAHKGPFFWITRSSAAIYKSPKPDREQKLGYVKRGGKLPILEGKVDGDGCSKGWYKVASGGYVCSLVGTTDKNAHEVKFRPNQPNLEDILPYPYKRNAKNGTPLYKSIPSEEQTFRYEPYLPGAIKAAEELKKKKEADRQQLLDAGFGVGGSLNAEEKTDKDGKPIWEREEDLHEVTLDDLKKDSDAILASRMMKGFYVAVDKTFKWDGRTYYKTTKGLVTPADRFWATEGSDFHGVEIDGENVSLPIGWVFGVNKTVPTYEIDTETDERKTKGTKKHFEMVQLQYRYHAINKIDYFQMTDGDWIRDRHIRMTTPGERPKEVGPNERWIDVDISEQTLVVFEGDRPVYATLISSGKESSIKEKDHSTPRGMWRVREKHIASTMDGDGSAAGDLPYSIEDVPYIMYFHKSYATHGAFWHRNYGYQMSHGCINMAPLDAKWVFLYADPQLPEGFHGNWSNEEDKGSMVVVHD